MNSLSATFDSSSGNLFISEKNCLIASTLYEVDFLNSTRHDLLYSDKDFFTRFGFFHFNPAVQLWSLCFRLTVHFSPKPPDTSNLCTGYALRLYKYPGEQEDESITAQFENLISDLVGTSPELLPFPEIKRWKTSWGEIRVGPIIQNGTEPQISIGWCSE